MGQLRIHLVEFAYGAYHDYDLEACTIKTMKQNEYKSNGKKQNASYSWGDVMSCCGAAAEDEAAAAAAAIMAAVFVSCAFFFL